MNSFQRYKNYRRSKIGGRFDKWSKRIIWTVVILIFLVIIWFASMLMMFSDLMDNQEDFDSRLIKMEETFNNKFSCKRTDVIKEVRKSVVRVVGGEAEGSGFAIDNNGLILTNFHVIEFEPSPKIIFPDNTFENGEIIMTDKDADLAIIKVKKQLPALNLGNDKELESGEELIAIGFALGGTLSGEASVSVGTLAGRRSFKEHNVDYLQMDNELVGGVSGGPMVTACGDVVGVNTLALTGMGFAISAHTIKDKWLEMEHSSSSLENIERITFEPNKSPLDAVSSFYNYLKIRKLEKAFKLLSDNFNKGYGFSLWKIGYESLLDTTLVKIEVDEKNDKIIHVWLTSKDFVGDEIIYRYFKGQWEVKEVDGKWLLWSPSIREVEDYWELMYGE